MTDVLEWYCPECNKLIRSLYERQFEYLIRQHQLKHEMKPTKEEK